MKINFQLMPEEMSLDGPDRRIAIAEYLASYKPVLSIKPSVRPFHTAEGYEHYHIVDCLGESFVWLNDTFPEEQYTWYYWFESVFLIPDEMLPLVCLKFEVSNVPLKP